MIVSIIPARGGSKGIPYKNIQIVNGKPLIVWTIEASLNSIINKTFVTTEDIKIADVAELAGAHILHRPKCLAGDDSQMPEVCHFALRQIIHDERLKPDIVVILTPTTPLRTFEHINEAVERYRKDIYYVKSVFAGSIDKRYHWRWRDTQVKKARFPGPPIVIPDHDEPRNRQGRQDVDSWLIEESGAIYVVGVEDYVRERDFRLAPFSVYLMSKEDSLDIDEPADIVEAEKRMKAKSL